MPDELGIIAARQTGKIQLPSREERLVVYFDPVEETDPTYLKWLSGRKLRYASREGVPVFVRQLANGTTQPLVELEVKTLTLALAGLSWFFYLYGRNLWSPWYINHSFKTLAGIREGKALGHNEIPDAPEWSEVSFPPADFKFRPDEVYEDWKKQLEKVVEAPSKKQPPYF